MPTKKMRTLVIRDADKVRALRTPIRREIIEALVRIGGGSVKELAEELGRAPATLYYHIRELEAAGLIKEAGERSSGKRTERIYEPAAGRIVIDRRERSGPFVSALADLHGSTLRTAERELARALDPKRTTEVPPEESVTLLRLTAKMRPRAAARAQRMLRELAEYIGENNDPKGGDTYAMTALLVRVVPRGDGGQRAER